MYYYKWSEKEIQQLQSVGGMVNLYTEIDPDGNVRREIGLNQSGKVIHKFPSNLYPNGRYGLFDNQKVIVTDRSSTIAKDEFEKLWEVSY